MNFRVCDNLVYWLHRGLAAAGKIHAKPLAGIQRDGFQRILVVATTAIGDAVLCAPLIDSLRKALPQARVGFWVSAAAVPLFEGRAGLDSVLPYHGKYRRVRQSIEELRRERYDLALVANANDPDVIPMIWWSGCKRIIRRPQRNTIYSFMIANPEMLSASHTSGHAIVRNLEFCDLLRIPRGEARTRIEVKPETGSRVRSLVGKAPQPWWCIHPGSSRPEKQWEAGRYAELARRILGKFPGTLLITGARHEKPICDQVEREVGEGGRVHNFAAQFRLDELAALLKCVRLLISGDTGPYHIAMALDTPTVTLFAPWDAGSSAAINGPYFDREIHRVVETAHLREPISTIEVDRVFDACASFFA